MEVNDLLKHRQSGWRKIVNDAPRATAAGTAGRNGQPSERRHRHDPMAQGPPGAVAAARALATATVCPANTTGQYTAA